MAIYKLTPKEPNKITGFSNPLMAWHFVGAEALDVFASFARLDAADWDYNLGKDPDDRRLQRLSLTKQIGDGQTHVQHVVKYGYWYALDGEFIHVLSSDDVANDYNQEEWVSPSPPA